MGTGPGIINDAAHEYNKAYVIPSQFTLPPRPNTLEACIKVLEGGSWHGKDVAFFHAMKPVAANWQYIFIAIFFVLFVVFLVLYLTQRTRLALSNRATAPGDRTASNK